MYTLYGGPLSLYTGKARAYLTYKQLDWQEQLATREVYKEIILPQIGAPIVPVLASANGDYVQDTTDIIDYLEARHPERSVYPQTPVQRLVALLLECYGDEWLLMPAMHYRWSVLDQQYDFIMSEFGKMSRPDASLEEQIAVGEKTSAPFRGSIGALGINEHTIPGIERAYRELLLQLNEHFSAHDYLLGGRPSIGDFGFMGPLYAHLGRDPVPKALMQDIAPAVYAWVERMNAACPTPGDWVADDDIPATLLPVLQTLAADFLPDVLDVMRHNREFVAANPGANVPRVLGMHDFTTGGCSGQRYIHSYAQWMFQRPLRHYQSLSGSELAACDTLLKHIGAYEALQTPLDCPLRREPGQLELVAEA